jgi:hypothetical protein
VDPAERKRRVVGALGSISMWRDLVQLLVPVNVDIEGHGNTNMSVIRAVFRTSVGVSEFPMRVLGGTELCV